LRTISVPAARDGERRYWVNSVSEFEGCGSVYTIERWDIQTAARQQDGNTAVKQPATQLTRIWKYSGHSFLVTQVPTDLPKKNFLAFSLTLLFGVGLLPPRFSQNRALIPRLRVRNQEDKWTMKNLAIPDSTLLFTILVAIRTYFLHFGDRILRP